MEQPTTKDFYIHLHQNNFQAALDLATDLQLDKDLVYKAQWTKQKKERDPLLQSRDIAHLKLINDSIWVVNECLDTCVANADVQREILNEGLARVNTLTDPVLVSLTSDQQDTVSERNKALLRARYYLLKYSDRLNTFIKIWPSLSQPSAPAVNTQRAHLKTNDTSFANAYSQFRDSNLIALAIEFARFENNTALDAIFMHHGKEVLPHRLFILSQIPETSDPSRFDLPHVTHNREDLWQEEAWREQQDPVEEPWLQDFLQLNAQEELDYLARLQKNIDRTDYPTSSKVIADWYMDRAHAADKIGLSNNALEISRYAQVMGVTGIENDIADYEWLCKYIYVNETTTDETGAAFDDSNCVTLDKFQQLSNNEILEGLLSKTDSDTIGADMQNLALPWIEYCRRRRNAGEHSTEEPAEYLLYKWLLNPELVDNHLDWCCTVMEASKPTVPLEERIIKDDFDLSRLILSIVYFTDGDMQYLIRLFECLPIFSDIKDQEKESEMTTMADLMPHTNTPFELFIKLQNVGANGLTQMMDALQTQLGSAEILARYHTAVPLRWYLQEQSIDSQRQLCIRMSSQAVGGIEYSRPGLDHDDDWRELLDDMIRLNEDDQGVFGKLETKEVLEIFFSSLLRSGRFNLAKELILGSQKMLDINKAEKLVIDAEREFYDNATSGNMHAGRMKQAWDCLKTLPPTSEIKKELDLIAATHTLIHDYRVQDRPGITLMPIQIRQSKNRLELIAKLLNTRRDMYLQHTQILDLVQKLGYGGDSLAKVKALAMLASAALVDEDYMASYNLCQLTVEAAQSIKTTAGKPKSYYDQINQSAWQVCFNLGKLETFDDMNRRLDVLSMAMALSPPENIHDVLSVWRKLDQNKPDQIGLAQLSADSLGDNHQTGKSWQGLLQSATKQWSLGELLAGGEQSKRGNEANKRKRDILRDAVGGWLF